MNGTLFSDGQITVFTVLLAISVLIPIVLFVWYFMKKKAKLASYFLGFLGMVFMIAGKYLLDMIFVDFIGLGDFLKAEVHPVYTALYAALSTGLLMTLSTFFILKYAMVDRTGKENALLMLIGKSGLYLIMYGAVPELTYMSVARTVNDMGLDKYISSMTDESIRATQKTAVEALAARPMAEIISEGVLQIVILILHIALGVLVYMGIHKAKDILSAEKLEHIKKENRDIAWYEKRREGMFSLAMILQVVALIPVCLLQVGIGTDYAIILMVADILLTSATAFGCYAMYKQVK